MSSSAGRTGSRLRCPQPPRERMRRLRSPGGRRGTARCRRRCRRPGASTRPAPPTPATRAGRRPRWDALRQVLRAVLALLAPDGDVEVVRLVDPLARLVLARRVHGDASEHTAIPEGVCLSSVVPRQVADNDDAVDVASHSYSSSSSTDALTASSRVGAPTATGRAGLPDPTCRHVAHDPVVDAKHARDLVERRQSHVNCSRW